MCAAGQLSYLSLHETGDLGCPQGTLVVARKWRSCADTSLLLQSTSMHRSEDVVQQSPFLRVRCGKGRVSATSSHAHMRVAGGSENWALVATRSCRAPEREGGRGSSRHCETDAGRRCRARGGFLFDSRLGVPSWLRLLLVPALGVQPIEARMHAVSCLCFDASRFSVESLDYPFSLAASLK